MLLTLFRVVCGGANRRHLYAHKSLRHHLRGCDRFEKSYLHTDFPYRKRGGMVCCMTSEKFVLF